MLGSNQEGIDENSGFILYSQSGSACENVCRAVLVNVDGKLGTIIGVHMLAV